MAKNGCQNPQCAYSPVSLTERLIVTAFFSAAVLFVPFANSIGLSLDQDIRNTELVFKASGILPLFVWIGAMYMAYKEDADHHLSVIFNALGIPGSFVGASILVAQSVGS